ISASRCILPVTEPVRPKQGPHIGTTERVPASFARPARPVRRCGRPDDDAPLQSSAPRRSNVTYVDRTLNCVDCGVEFIHSAADQEYYQQKGFVSDPKRCTSCRASRRASRDGGYDVRDIGGPRGYERGDDRPTREYFAVVCSSCGNQAQVPFKPRMDRPVYCSDCFRTVKPGRSVELVDRFELAEPLDGSAIIEPEGLTGSVAIAPATPPERDAGPAVDLPGAI